MSNRKHILITGVSSGIGYDAVGFLIEKGYHVLGSVRKESDLQKLNLAYPEHFTCLQFDVTKTEEVQAAYGQVKTVLGDNMLAGLVNNAGLALGLSLIHISEPTRPY